MATDHDNFRSDDWLSRSREPRRLRSRLMSMAAGAGIVLATATIVYLLAGNRTVETSATSPTSAGTSSDTVAASTPSAESSAPETIGNDNLVATLPRSEALQAELNRLVAGTPIIFGPSETGLTELHLRILNNAAMILSAYPEAVITIVGYTDNVGDPQANEQVSLARGQSVRDYLVSQGIPEATLLVEARGEDDSSGSAALASLERRVEFEVATAVVAGQTDENTLKIAIVAPSARNDLAFTQSMVDAVNIVANERGNVSVAITDNTFVPEEAAAAIRGYAGQGYDLVIAHGSQFGSSVFEIAPEFPNVAFAWGTASDTFQLPNVYAYDVAANEGGYVLGALSAMLTTSNVIGVVGPIEVGDAGQYIRGFTAGAAADNPNVNMLVSYTGSFSDMGLAAELADAHLNAGADVMTGSAQMVVGAISSSQRQGALWFGNQANQASLATDIVVASQVYHWEVALRPIINDIDAGILAGTTYTADLANGGLVIEYNPAYPLTPESRQWADALTAAISNGTVIAPG